MNDRDQLLPLGFQTIKTVTLHVMLLANTTNFQLRIPTPFALNLLFLYLGPLLLSPLSIANNVNKST